jgi:hypothetical protein
VKYTTRPISDRTAFTGEHKPNPFRATWADTLKLLDFELDLLNASDVVFEVDVDDESQIRLDGMLRAGAKVNSPAVRLAFDSAHGPLTYATDRFRGQYYSDPPDWQINLRAIALGLEALRKMDRYGITRRGEQYTGWKALPAGRAMPASHMTTEQARDLITSIIGPVDRPWDTRIRMAKAATHPDRNDGDRTLWDQVEQAEQVLSR